MADTTPSQDPLRLAEALERMRPEFCGNQATLLEAAALIREQHAALAAPQPNAALADGWRDIASAPKDGTTLLLWEQYSYAPVLGYYSKQIGKWFADMEHYDTDGNACVIDKLSQELITHWQYPPAPPSLNASKEAGNG